MCTWAMESNSIRNSPVRVAFSSNRGGPTFPVLFCGRLLRPFPGFSPAVWDPVTGRRRLPSRPIGSRVPAKGRDGLLLIAIAKDFGGERFEGRPMQPCVGSQAGLATSLLEKRQPVPAVFDRHLGQQ